MGECISHCFAPVLDFKTDDQDTTGPSTGTLARSGMVLGGYHESQLLNAIRQSPRSVEIWRKTSPYGHYFFN